MSTNLKLVSVMLTPDSPNAGDRVTFSAVIKNDGDAATPPDTIIGVGFSVDGRVETWSDYRVSSMVAGESTMVSANGGPNGTPYWTATAGRHRLLGWVDDINRIPEGNETDNKATTLFSVSEVVSPEPPPVIVPPVSSAGVPQPAVSAGFNRLDWSDDFNTLSLYDPDGNRNGTWAFFDFWQGNHSTCPGYVDLAGNRTFCVNQLPANNAVAPYRAASILSPSVLRLTCRRAHLPTRDDVRNLVNPISKSQFGGVDVVTWLGAYMTTTRFVGDDTHISRPAYIEYKMRMSPLTKGIFSSCWLYSVGDWTHPADDGKSSVEIDVFESNDCDPTFFKTNFHKSGAESGAFALKHDKKWCDGQWHTYGMLWEVGKPLKIYYDNVLSGQTTADYASWFNVPMRIIITHTCDPSWANSALYVPKNIEEVYMDLDFIRVWKP